ncbi:hypothetical protein ACROYT_G009515 [Oculina patagonica]
MRLWYPLVTWIFYSVFCCEAHNKGSTIKQHEESLLKFFKLNDESRASGNETVNISNKNESLHLSEKCGPLVKKLCAHRHKSKTNTVKKSFRPRDFDDDDDEEDYNDYDEAPDDEEFPEDTETGSYRSFDDSRPSAPRNHERLYDDDSDVYDRESWQGHDFEDEDSRSHDRPGYEDDTDDWDWDSPRRHRGRHSFSSSERWHDLPQDDDYEPDYPPQYHHHSRHPHYHHHHYRPQVHASFRTLGQATPSWLTYSQGYPRGSPYPSPAQYVSNPMSTIRWTNPATYQPRWQPRYYSLPTVAPNSFNTQLAGPSRVNLYQQRTVSYPERESNSFFIPPYHVSSPSYLQATTRNLVDFASPNPGMAATLPRLSNHIYHYPRVVAHPRHFIGPFRRPFLRHQEFPDSVLNSLRDLNLH